MDYTGITDDIAKGLLELKSRIKQAKIPPSKIDETLNLATWNVREFGEKARLKASLFYIAEILNQFDLVSVVELRDNVSDPSKVLKILGPEWRAVYSDAILDAGGNRERIAYLFDRRAVTFNGLAAEAQAPREKKDSEYLSVFSWWRSPYMASFRSGNFDFVCIAAHIRWGDSEERRRIELQGLADWVEEKAKEKNAEDKDIFVMGDFNIPSEKSPLFKDVTAKGLKMPDKLLKSTFGSNLEKDKRYDQILHLPLYPESFCNSGGVLDFYQGNHTKLIPGISKTEFTFQLSDHLPLWIQVNTDTDEQKLEQLIQG